VNRVLTFLFNFAVIVGVFFCLPFVFLFVFFFADYDINEDVITGKELFKPWE